MTGNQAAASGWKSHGNDPIINSAFCIHKYSFVRIRDLCAVWFSLICIWVDDCISLLCGRTGQVFVCRGGEANLPQSTVPTEWRQADDPRQTWLPAPGRSRQIQDILFTKVNFVFKRHQESATQLQQSQHPKIK